MDKWYVWLVLCACSIAVSDCTRWTAVVIIGVSQLPPLYMYSMVVPLHFLCVCGSWQKQCHMTAPEVSCNSARSTLITHEYLLDSGFQFPDSRITFRFYRVPNCTWCRWMCSPTALRLWDTDNPKGCGLCANFYWATFAACFSCSFLCVDLSTTLRTMPFSSW